MSTFTSWASYQDTCSSRRWRYARFQVWMPPTGAVSSIVLHGARMRTKFEPRLSASPFDWTPAPPCWFTPRRTTGRPFWSVNPTPWTCTHGETVAAAAGETMSDASASAPVRTSIRTESIRPPVTLRFRGYRAPPDGRRYSICGNRPPLNDWFHAHLSVPFACHSRQLLDRMRGLERADGAGLRAHDQRGRERASRAVSHATEQVAVGDSGGGEEDVLAPDQVVGREDLLEVVSRVDGSLRLLVVSRPQPAHELAAEALEGGRREDALGRSADPPQEVDARVGARRHHRPGDVAVGDEADARARRADAGHHLVVAGAVEDHDHQVAHARFPRPGDRLERLLDRRVHV